MPRRAVLAATGLAGAGVLTGCSWFADEPPPPPPDPLEPLLAATRSLAAGYSAVLAAFPDLAGRLDPLHQTHRAHETALLGLIGRPDLVATSPASPPATPLATDAAGALRALRQAERDGRDEASAACLAAAPERAAVLGSIAAARATHVEVL